MRVLFSSLDGSGHFHPLVPTAKALQKAGHEVAFAVPASLQAVVEANGFRTFTAGIGFETLLTKVLGLSVEDMLQRQAAMLDRISDEQREMMAGMFIDGFARQRLPELVAICEHFQPDLLVAESMEFAAGLVGEKLGIPHATIQVGGMLLSDSGPEYFAQRMDVVRAGFGLPSDAGMEWPYRYLHLSFMPRNYFARTLPPSTRYLRAEVFDRSGSEVLPEWVSTLGGRPLVYATLGTAFNKLTHHLNTIATGVQQEPVDLILTVGRDLDPSVLGPRPANVHVERYIPQSLLLPRCDLAILHGGYSSVMSALYAGVPSLIVPLGADQPMNAEASARIGMSRVVRPTQLTPEFIRQQVREMLADTSSRERVRRLQAEVQALPGVEHGVELLERLARDKTL
ncbi:MAG: glycosyltransferase [Cystobacter sp.]